MENCDCKSGCKCQCWLHILIGLLIIAGAAYGGYYYTNNQDEEAEEIIPEEEVVEEEVVEEEGTGNDGWVRVEKEEYGFSFLYPEKYEVDTDKIRVEYEGSDLEWYSLIIADYSTSEEPMLVLDVNPDGYGPIFADRIYGIEEGDNGYIKITSTEDQEGENMDDETFWILINGFEASNGNNYSFQFRYNGEENAKLTNEFENILTTFQFS